MRLRKNVSFRKNRTIAAVILVGVLTFSASLNLLIGKVKALSDVPERDAVSLYEEQMQKIKAVLPPNAAVGYVSAVENEKIFLQERTFQNVEFLAQYILTQYSLAPMVVYNSPDQPIVIGNFLDGPPDPAFINKHGLIPVKDWGDGLVLYKKADKP